MYIQTIDTQKNRDVLTQKYGNAPLQTRLAETLLATHATSFTNLLSILKDKKIYSYQKLQKIHPHVVADPLLTTTDQLDIRLGLDKYAFLTMGRCTSSELAHHYLLCKNTLTQTTGALASLLEIGEYGALVSPHAENYFKTNYGFSDDTIAQVNTTAKELFAQGVVRGKDFGALFDARYNTHYQDTVAYTTSLEFPEPTPPQSKPFPPQEITYRQGPQLMVPNSVNLEDNLVGILDVYGKGNLKTSIKPKFGVKKEQIVSLPEVVRTCYGATLVPLLYEMGTQPTNKKILLINQAIHHLGVLTHSGYDGDLQSGLIDMLKS